MDTQRRKFLMAGAAAVAGRFVFAVPSEKKVRVGIVGGSFGATFFFHEHPNCIVEAVSDLRPERREHLMKWYGCSKSYESLEKMLQDPKIEAVLIATPAPDHFAHVLQTLRAGKHVMSAVPAVLGHLDECHKLIEAVKKSGLKYMMAETSYYHQTVITARQYYKDGKFGKIFSAEAEYHHPGVEVLNWENGKRTWRYGLAPMHYPTHCTSMLIGVTGERLTHVSCIGFDDDNEALRGNDYKNPFWNATALFKSDRNTAFRVHVYWRGAERGTERGQWYGTKMSLFCPDPNGLPAMMVREKPTTEKDEGGFPRRETEIVPYEQQIYWKTDMLPDAMRHKSYHDGSHTFLTHEFVQCIVEDRKPAIDVYEAVAYTAPGIVAHESALRGGEWMKIPVFDPKQGA